MKNFPESITKQKTKLIYEQIDKSVYQLTNINKKCGIGFFSCINYKQNKIPVLISSYKTNNEKYLSNNNSIDIKINDKNITIEFGKAKYLNKDYGLAIIEISKENIKKLNFVEIDDNKSENEVYNKETIYVIHINNQNENCVSYGIINEISINSNIFFSCNINQEYAEGAPIFNIFNQKVIGIYIKYSRYFNEGLLLKSIINDFIKEYKNSRLESNYIKKSESFNEIDILIKVGKDDINNNIYFLDNYKDEKGNRHLKELNESNTEIYIDNNKYDFNKYFIPEDEGDYDIKIKFNINLTDCSYMFAGCRNIIKINFISFNTKYITNMKNMFYECKNLKKLNLLFFNTEKVTDMSNMFYRCHKIKFLDLTSFDTKNVEYMCYMFFCCKNLFSINLSNFNTEKVKDMSYMFFDCWNLENKNSLIKNINNNAKSINMYSNMWDFNNSNLFNFIDLENEKNDKNEINILINIEKEHVNKNIYFLNQTGLVELYNSRTELYINNNKCEFNKFIIAEKEGEYNIKLKFSCDLRDCSNMFNSCENIININFIAFESKYDISMKSMFEGCKNLKNINFNKFNTKNVTTMQNMFSNCNDLKNIDLSGFNTKNVNDMSFMFSNCHNLKNLDFSSLIQVK